MNVIEAKHLELQNAVVRVTGSQIVLDVVNLHRPTAITWSKFAERHFADCHACSPQLDSEIDWPCDTTKLIAKAVNVDVMT